MISWQTERDLELLDGVWTMLGEWTAHMDTWKFGKFREIDVGTIEAAAAQYSKRITKLGKEVKQTGRDWKVLDALRERVESIKKLMPLITDLRNPVRIPSRRTPRRTPRRCGPAG